MTKEDAIAYLLEFHVRHPEVIGVIVSNNVFEALAGPGYYVNEAYPIWINFWAYNMKYERQGAILKSKIPEEKINLPNHAWWLGYHSTTLFVYDEDLQID